MHVQLSLCNDVSGVCCTGSHGVHLEMSARNKKALLFYKKLGFSMLQMDKLRHGGSDHMDKVLILGQSL